MSALTDRIVALAKKRIPPHAIAAQLRVKPDQVYSAIRYARTKGEDIPCFSTRPSAAPVVPPKQVALPVRLYSLLEREAERRGLTPSEAAQRLLETALLSNWSQSDA